MNLPTNVTSFPYFDWAKAALVSASRQLWVAFHSRNEGWLDGRQPLELQATLSDGTRFSGSWLPVLYNTTTTWITPRDSRMWTLHIHNYDKVQSAMVMGVAFNGVNVTAVPTLPLTLAPGQHLVLGLQPPSTGPTRGQVFTVTVFVDGHAVSHGGRTPEQRYPIETWPSSSDCPVQGVNAETYQQLTDNAIDTVFYAAGDFEAKCGRTLKDVINNNATVQHFWTDPAGLAGIDRLELVSTAFLADEADGQLDNSLRTLLATHQQVADAYPSVLTYQGGKTNRHNGAYAGITDIQGLDFYVASCAPTIIPVEVTLPFQGSYAYIRNARNNHMPLPAMTYSQLYSGCTAEGLLGWAYQANGNELAVELGYVLLSGAKGMTLFQTTSACIKAKAADWEGLLRDVFLSIAHPIVREVLRTGDIESLRCTSSDPGDPIKAIASLFEPIRNHEWILFVVVNTNANGYSNLLCHVDAKKHWVIQDHTIVALTFDLSAPDISLTSIQLDNLQEVVGGKLLPRPQQLDPVLNGSTLTLRNVGLTGAAPVRFFLLPYKQVS